MEKKGRHGRSLGQRGGEGWREPRREPTPAWTGFYCFSRHITSRMVLFTMHRFVLGGYLLQKTKERIFLSISKKKDICKCKGDSGWTSYTPYLGGLAQTLGRWYSVNICSLYSGWGSFSKSKSHSSLGTMQAWLPKGEPVCGGGCCMLNLTPTGFSKWELGYISHVWE